MRSLLLAISVVVFSQASTVAAQNPTATIRVQVRASEKPVEDAEVVVAGTTYRTDAAGLTTVTTAPGAVEVTVLKAGFAPATASVQVAAGAVQEVVVELQPQPTVEETVTVVASTRTDKRLEDQPMRVEVLSRDEIEEKMLMTPGDIVMMLNEMGGMRVQATSPSLGAASVRIQGMRGRYTRVLSDGLPLFGDVVGLGLLQIPPMDLGQVEVIKGVASALYGAGAMGGVINLLSRRSAAEPAQEFLVNRSTLGATDAVTFLYGPLSRGWSASLLGGGHWQTTTDVNDDAWADLPGYKRGVVRPRVFWDGGNGRTLFATTGFTYEDRDGGTLNGEVLAATGQPYVEALETRRYDAGAVAQFLVTSCLLGRQLRARATTISLVKSWSAIATIPPSGKWPFVEPRVARHGLPVSRLSVTPTRRAMCPSSTTRSSCQAYSFSTMSTSRPRCRCRRVPAWMCTASTAPSSVLGCRRWRAPDTGPAGCRLEPGSLRPLPSLKRPKRPASRV
jgi:TonB-dependent Receptor Plug Domain